MSSKKKYKTINKRKIDFSHIVTLPKIKNAEKYFKNFSKSCKLNGATLYVNNLYLLITAENEEILANVRTIVGKEIWLFIESSKSPQEMLPQKKISPVRKSRIKHKKLIPQRVSRTIRLRDTQHSKHVNRILRKKQQYWNNIRTTWKQWYIDRFRINTKFKTISQYFGQMSKLRHSKFSMNHQIKRSTIEYHQQKVFGRDRDLLKAKHAQRPKRKNKLRKTSRYKSMLHDYRRAVLQISKLKCITVDSDKTEIFQSKSKMMPWLRQKFHFPLLPCVSKTSVDRNKFVIRYYNQHMFIYKASTSKNRPLKRNLIGTFSTLNEDEMKSNWDTEHIRFSPIKQPSRITQHNKNSSPKKKPKVVRKTHHQINVVHMPDNDPTSKCAKVKSKK